MINVAIDNISLNYGDKTIVKNFSMKVKQNEILAIVGPSGCGKTTILRALCGFMKPTEGEIKIKDRVVYSKKDKVAIAPEKRAIGVVFQDYAVWPHLTVLENVIYPLKKMKVKKAEAEKRAIEAIAQVRMKGYENYMPSQLSGGQQQRIAIARALVASQELVVLDEPITNLDAKLREEMVYEIQLLQKTLGTTIIFITHDQETSMMLADRIVILNREGEICQIGTADEIIKNPSSKFVFEFIGVSNFIPIKIKGNKAYIQDKENLLECPVSKELLKKKGVLDIVLAIRPMDINFVQEGGIPAKINRVTYLGNQYDYFVQVGDYEIRVQQDAYEASRTKVYKEDDFCNVEFIKPFFYSEKEEGRIC